MTMPFTKKNTVLRYMETGEEEKVSALIKNVFAEYIAPDYPIEGQIEFSKYIVPEAIRERVGEQHFILVAEYDHTIIGVIEVRDYYHVSLFFVDSHFMGKGIGKELYRQSLEICKRMKSEITKIEVNSSPYAVPIYEKLGFKSIGKAQTKNGIIFVPMEHLL